MRFWGSCKTVTVILQDIKVRWYSLMLCYPLSKQGTPPQKKKGISITILNHTKGSPTASYPVLVSRAPPE